jgi:hypothetical protein
VTVPIVAVCGQVLGDTGPPADHLICHDVVNRNALHNRAELGRFTGHFENNPTNLPEAEGLFQNLFTSRDADDWSARQKKDSLASVSRRAIRLDFAAIGATKGPHEWLLVCQNEVSSTSFARESARNLVASSLRVAANQSHLDTFFTNRHTRERFSSAGGSRMRAVWAAVAAVCVVLPGRVTGQGVPPADEPPLGGGTTVSRPLTPVDIPPVGPPAINTVEPPKPEPVERVEEIQQQKYQRRGPLGPSWSSKELLLWWPKAHPLPPLVTGSRTGAPPVLGEPGTTLFVGNRALDNQDIAGGRFTLGWSLNEPETVGFELVYFFLGSRTLHQTFRDVGNPRARALGLPYVNALPGREDVFPLAAPGLSTGSVFVTTTTRVQGAEANFVANLHDGKTMKLNGLVGYRFLQVHEGLTVEQMRIRFGTPGEFGPIYDQFDAHNRFHGGQLGLHADMSFGVVFCELTGKVALGQTFEVVKIDGATATFTPVLGGVAIQRLPGGVYALPTNIGRYTQGTFAVVPEGTFKVGLKLGDCARFYVGYNFLYLSDAVRPGDQLDRTLNPALIPVLNPGGGFASPDRPRPLFNRSDFWAQGLLIGLETRY